MGKATIPGNSYCNPLLSTPGGLCIAHTFDDAADDDDDETFI